ncbi:hypothetical protein FOL47_008238 [Perkinsus chesapeaki]|uniref:Uncharacterized protein n=1 Tax=Perkinsus chesapeaki TaxID=330153 RepID=A0A7J6LF95_PERCH|nr:hypothetical protein FOL47_008238 [Perkinsus chesapeaki]
MTSPSLLKALTWRSVLQLSRPGLWFVLAWFFVWPTGGYWAVCSTPQFLIGFFYCTFPLNLFTYGLNDMVDFDTDQLNDRKGNYYFGAKASQAELAELPLIIILCNLFPIAALVAITDNLKPFMWLALYMLSNVLYNVPPFALSRKGPWEIPCVMMSVVFLALFSCELNNVPLPSLEVLAILRRVVIFNSTVILLAHCAWLFHVLAVARSELYAEILDREDDAKVGKRTTAVKAGRMWTSLLTCTLTFCHMLVSYFMLKSTLLSVYYIADIAFFISYEEVLYSKSSSAKFAGRVFKIESLVGLVFFIYAWSNQVLA